MKGQLKIHSENILPIIKQWLYSDTDIFLRELVSNATDALQKWSLLGNTDIFRIDVSINAEEKTITISDNGIGMTMEEIETYICQIAFSGAEDFVQKYAQQKDQFIGHFGLGFYSAFMVSSSVEIETKSENGPAAHWQSDGSSTYEITEGKRETRGTDIILHVSNDEYLDHDKLRTILKTYCPFLPYSIYLNNEEINNKPPLWLKKPNECTEEEYLDFYKTLYPNEPNPIFWIHFHIDHPFNLKTILYFPKITPRFDYQSSHIKLFCNRVFVTDNCKDLFPNYLTMLRGAIDSIDIPLNVSRSALQKDSNVKKLSTHISKKIADRLASLYTEERERFISYWPEIETIVKFSLLQDEKFYERAKGFLLWKTLNDKWMTAEELGTKTIFYTTHTDSPFLALYKEKGLEVIHSQAVLDTSVFQALERNLDVKFQRIDSDVPESLLTKPDDAKEIGTAIEALLENLTVEAKHFENQKLPAFLKIDEGSRRFRDYLAMTQKEMPIDPLGKETFVVNTNSPLIQAILGLQKQDQGLAKQLAKTLVDLSRLSQKELHFDNLAPFVSQTTELLEALSLKLQ